VAIQSKSTRSSQTKKSVRRKPRNKPRNKPRIAASKDHQSRKKLHMATAGLSEKQAPKVHAVGNIVDGELLVSAVLAETCPVADYANVVIGPAGFQWKLGGIDMGILADVDWDDEDDLTPEQQAVFNKAQGALRSTIVVIESVINEDRETVERSIRQHNEREASEPKKKSNSRRLKK
jgi:hypothetical protein